MELQREKHLRYWKRCAKTLLPTEYTGNDANRVLLGYFIVAALDVLGGLEEGEGKVTSAAERQRWIEWLYQCQHPGGGFRGFTGTDFGGSGIHLTADNGQWDPANLPATYLGLVTLVTLGDDLSRVDRKQCLRWLRRLQRPDGSFGESLGEDGRVEGGHDTRFCYVAAGTRWVLRGMDTGGEDMDVERLVGFLNTLETYDFGFSEAPFHEAHAGFTYCTLGTLAFLDKLDPHDSRWSRTTRWLVSRQRSDGEVTSQDASSCGFNGRCNKRADTCYSFWVGGSLSLLQQQHLISEPAHRTFLLRQTQHLIGGFSKLPGDPPDVLHSFLGLAALSALAPTMLDRDQLGLKPVDPMLSTSVDTRLRVEQIWTRWSTN